MTEWTKERHEAAKKELGHNDVWALSPDIRFLLEDALAEIERLQAEIDRLRKVIRDPRKEPECRKRYGVIDVD